MWLLNSCSWEIKEFISYKQAPPYAILTHTWGNEEVTFRDWQSEPSKFVERKEGFKKIKLCCQQAAADGFEWVWIDTCCIDKTSSAEITEAINSMFQWYRNATVCYAYLNDVEDDIESNLAGCRWVTRGWTLQELIAPREVVFYSSSWHALGTRSRLSSHIATVTGINEPFLTGRSLEHATIAQRMSWAAKRTTSRDEDMAYCLLGIFDVNMPLIYGEGWKAFKRLQEILINEYPEDFSLFAWGRFVEELPNAVHDDQQIFGSKPIQLDPDEVIENLFGLLAESPKDFEHSGWVIPPPDIAGYFEGDRDYRMVPKTPSLPVSHLFGRTARVNLPKFTFGVNLAFHVNGPLMVARLLKFEFMVIPCGRWDISHTKFQYITITITGAENKYSRTYEMMFNDAFTSKAIRIAKLALFKNEFTISPVVFCPPQAGDLVIRRHVTEYPLIKSWSTYGDVTLSSVDGRVKCPSSRRGPIFSLDITYSSSKISLMLCVLFIRLDDLDHSHDDLTQGAKCGQYRVALGNSAYHDRISGDNDFRIPNQQDGYETTSVVEKKSDRLHYSSFDGKFGSGRRFRDVEITHDMAVPLDEWKFGIAGFADVYVSLERIYLDNYDNDDDSDECESHRFIDAVDLVVKDEGNLQEYESEDDFW